MEGSWATPGPWKAKSNADGHHVSSWWQRNDGESAGGDIVCDVFDRRDADLIALAPEMAEAILWGACDAFDADSGEQECGCPLCVAAFKLREIRGSE